MFKSCHFQCQCLTHPFERCGFVWPSSLVMFTATKSCFECPSSECSSLGSFGRGSSSAVAPGSNKTVNFSEINKHKLSSSQCLIISSKHSPMLLFDESRQFREFNFPPHFVIIQFSYVTHHSCVLFGRISRKHCMSEGERERKSDTRSPQLIVTLDGSGSQ